MPGMNGLGPHGFGPGTGGGFGRCGAGRGFAHRGFYNTAAQSDTNGDATATEIAYLRKQTAAIADRIETLSARYSSNPE
jgi:hypothetical protein